MNDLLTERAIDVDAWVKAHPGDLAEYLTANPPVHPDDLTAAETMIREEDPSGLPARCSACHRRMPMIQRDLPRHPKCTPEEATRG